MQINVFSRFGFYVYLLTKNGIREELVSLVPHCFCCCVQRRQKAKIFQGLVDYELVFHCLDHTSPVNCLFQAVESIMERSNTEMTEVPEESNEDSRAIVEFFEAGPDSHFSMNVTEDIGFSC